MILHRLYIGGMRKLLIIAALSISGQPLMAQVKILFDATKAEMAGNADWVIDADQTNIRFGPNAYLSTSGNQSNPQRVPTPAQSGITTGTPETYWTGALSSWAVDCVNRGYTVETLPYNGQITYGNTANPQDLANYNVYVVDEPNITFTSAEKTAMMRFVQNGGGLFMIADHNVSDRNGDGWDSPHVWNDFLSTNSVQPYPFGIYFDTVDFSQTTTNISATSTDSIIHGPMGNVAKVKYSGGTTMTLNPTLNPSVKGVVYKTGSTTANVNAMVAYARFGNGKVAAMGDSSPSDDSTGNPGCTLYNGYWTDAGGNHRLLLMNITIWLATRPPSTSVGQINGNAGIRLYPNPAKEVAQLQSEINLTNVMLAVYDITGRMVMQTTLPQLDQNQKYTINAPKGMYYVKVMADQTNATLKLIVE